MLIVAVTLELLPVTVLPNASCTASTGCVAKAAPAVAPAGWVVSASWLAAAGETVKGLVLTLVRAPSASWSVLAPAVSMRRLLKLAIPLTAATVVVPARVPLPVLSVAVTLDVSPVTVLP